MEFKVRGTKLIVCAKNRTAAKKDIYVSYGILLDDKDLKDITPLNSNF